MRLQVFSEYLQMAQEGRVNFLSCPMHPLEEAKFPLVHKLNEEDKIMLHCMACGYKNLVGEETYNYILKIIENEPKTVSDAEENN